MQLAFPLALTAVAALCRNFHLGATTRVSGGRKFPSGAIGGFYIFRGGANKQIYRGANIYSRPFFGILGVPLTAWLHVTNGLLTCVQWQGAKLLKVKTETNIYQTRVNI